MYINKRQWWNEKLSKKFFAKRQNLFTKLGKVLNTRVKHENTRVKHENTRGARWSIALPETGNLYLKLKNELNLKCVVFWNFMYYNLQNF